MAKKKEKSITTLFSLMGIRDNDDPSTTSLKITSKLHHIQQKKSIFKNTQLSSSSSSVIRQQLIVHLQPQTLAIPSVDDHHYDADQSFQDKRLKTEILRNNNSNCDISVKASSRNLVFSSEKKNNNVTNVINLNDFIRNMGGSEPELQFEKHLTRSDVAKNGGRLLIPAFQVMNPATFLTSYEKWLLANNGSISVKMFDPQRRKCTLNLGQWNSMSGNNYVLNRQWNQVVSVNGFKENMLIKLLSFRVDQQLCLAIVRV